jgi:hypothetical protein
MVLNNVRRTLLHALKSSSEPEEARAFLRYVRLQLFRRCIDRAERVRFWRALRHELNETARTDFRGPEVLPAALLEVVRYAPGSYESNDESPQG